MTDTPTRKDKGKAMKPPGDATHCGGYPTDTPTPDLNVEPNAHEWEPAAAEEHYSTPDLTAPEQVERLVVWLMDVHKMGDTSKNPEVWRTLEALSAKLEAERQAVGRERRLFEKMEEQFATQKARAEAAEAERDALSRALSYFLVTDPDNPGRWEYNREFAERMANKQLEKIARKKGGEG